MAELRILQNIGERLLQSARSLCHHRCTDAAACKTQHSAKFLEQRHESQQARLPISLLCGWSVVQRPLDCCLRNVLMFIELCRLFYCCLSSRLLWCSGVLQSCLCSQTIQLSCKAACQSRILQPVVTGRTRSGFCNSRASRSDLTQQQRGCWASSRQSSCRRRMPPLRCS